MNAQERTEQELRIQNAAFWLKQQEKEFPDWYDAGEPVFKLLAAYAKFREQYRASSLPQATPPPKPKPNWLHDIDEKAGIDQPQATPQDAQAELTEAIHRVGERYNWDMKAIIDAMREGYAENRKAALKEATK